MPDNVFGSGLVSAGGGVMKAPMDSPMCEAFRAAVADFCANKGSGKEFNEYFQEKLKGKAPKGTKIEKEVPFLSDKKGAKSIGDVVKDKAGELNALKGARPPNASAIRAAQGRLKDYRNAQKEIARLRQQLDAGKITHGQFRRGANNVIPKGRQVRYPDAMVNGYPVEAKGPGDSWGKRKSDVSGRMQKGDYKKIRADGKVVEASCKTCGGCSGKNGKGNGCPPPKPK